MNSQPSFRWRQRRRRHAIANRLRDAARRPKALSQSKPVAAVRCGGGAPPHATGYRAAAARRDERGVPTSCARTQAMKTRGPQARNPAAAAEQRFYTEGVVDGGAEERTHCNRCFKWISPRRRARAAGGIILIGKIEEKKKFKASALHREGGTHKPLPASLKRIWLTKPRTTWSAMKLIINNLFVVGRNNKGLRSTSLAYDFMQINCAALSQCISL